MKHLNLTEDCVWNASENVSNYDGNLMTREKIQRLKQNETKSTIDTMVYRRNYEPFKL